MITLAKEIYRLDIKIGVNGDSETKKKLTATEKMAEQTKKKIKALDKITANPDVKLKDTASKTLDKIKSKTEKLNNTTATAKIKAKDEATKTLNKIDSKIKSFIKSGVKKVISVGIAGAVALGGAGIGTSIKTFSEFEQGLSNVKAVTEATDQQMRELGNTAKSLGASTAWSAVNVTQAEELLGQAGFSVNETMTALPGLLSLASAGGLDLAAATDIASGTLRAFNLNASESSHVADVLALSASATNSDVTDLGDTMKYVAPVAQALGISLEDTAAASGLLSNANIKGSQAGTVLRQTMARLASPTKEALKLMKQYGINAFDAHGNMKPLNGVVDNLNKSLGNLTSQRRADIISTIFGTESMSGVLALMNQGGQSLSTLSQKLKEAKGSADKMAGTKLDNLAGQWEQLKGAAETLQINLGERLAPYAKQFVTWLTGKMPIIEEKVVSIVDYLSKNTATVKAVAGTFITLAAAYTGLSAVGKIGNAITGIKGLSAVLKGGKVAAETTQIAGGLKSIGVIGKILPAILNPVGLSIAGIALVAGTAIVANANLVKKGLSTTTEELGPFEKIMNKLTGSVYKSKTEMQKLGLAYEDFGSNVSDNFKQKVEESTKVIRDFQFYLNEINLDGVISNSESSEFDRKIKDMFDSAIKTIKDNQAKSQEGMKAMFLDDGIFSEAEKATLEYLSKDYDTKVTAEEEIKNKIYAIRKKAVDDHRALNNEDLKNIKEYQTQMAQIELEAVGGTTDEIAYAKNKLKARAQGADIKDGSSLAQEAAKDRDVRVVEVQAKYDTYIDKLKSQLATATNETDKNNLKSAIQENEKSRANKIAEINKLWNDDLNTLYNASPNLKGKINIYNGSELTSQDLTSQNNLEKIKSQYEDLKKITQSGFYGVRDSVTGSMNAIYVTVDQRTGDIVGAWDYTSKEVGGYTSEMKEKVKELGDSHVETSGKAISSLATMQAYVDTSTGEIKNSLGQVVGGLQNITFSADGTRTGILNLNGTPIQITSNASGQIINMSELGNSINNLPTEKTITITTRIIMKEFSVSPTSTHRGLGTMSAHANGTDNSGEGFSTVNERGWELSAKQSVPFIGRYNGDPLTYMSRGTKIVNHMQSVQDMKREVSRQLQHQLVKPQQQLQIAGVGGVSFGDVKVSVDGNQDVDNIVAQAAQEFAYKLKEALANIKK